MAWKSVWDDEEEEKKKTTTKSKGWTSVWTEDEDEWEEEQLLKPKEPVVKKEEPKEEKKEGFFKRAADWVKDVITPDKKEPAYTVRYDPREEGRAARSLDEVTAYTPRTKESTKKSAEIEIASINNKLSELDVKRQEVSKFLTRKVKPIEQRTPEERAAEKANWERMEALKAEYIGNEKVAKVTTMEDFLTKYLDEDYRTLEKSKQQLGMVVRNTQTGRSNNIKDLAREVGNTLERENLPLGIGGLFGITEELKKTSVKKKLSKGEKLTESEQITATQIRAESEFAQRDVGVLQVASGAIVPTLSIMADIGLGKALTGVTKAVTLPQKVINSLKVANTTTATTQLTRVVEAFAENMGDQYTSVTTEDGGFELVRTKEGDVPLTAAAAAIANVWGNNVIETLGGDLVDDALKKVFSPVAKVLGKSAKFQSLGDTKVAKVVKEMYVSKALRDLFARNSPLGELAEEFMASQYDKFTAGQPLGLTKDEAQKIAGSTLLMWGLLAPAGLVADTTKNSISQKDLEKLAPAVREEIENTLDLTQPVSEGDLQQVVENIGQKIEAGELTAGDLVPGAKGVTLYNATQGKVTQTSKEYENVLEVANNQIDVLRDLVEQGDTVARELLYGEGDVERTKIDFAKADYYIQQKFAGQYDAIKYNNEDRKILGAEYHDLKENKFYATSEDAAKLYKAQTRGEKYKSKEFIEFKERVASSLQAPVKGKSIKQITAVDNLSEAEQLKIAKDVWAKSSGLDAFPSINQKIAQAKSFPEVLKLIKEASGKNYDAVVSSYAVALDTRFNILRTKEAAKKPKTQKEKVKEVLEGEKPQTIKEIAKKTKILEPNIRRILGVGTKEGEFERVADGVYTLTKDGKSIAYIIPGDALVELPKLAKKGFKADMVFLDIPYKTPAITGGNRGMKYDFITPEQFGDVLDSVNKILKSKDSAVIYMFSNAESGLKKMGEYNNMLDKKGLKVIARGQWQKRFKTGEKVTNVRGVVAQPEGILLLSQSGNLSQKYAPIDLNFDLVRPKGYQSEKNADMIAQMIRMTTKEGDVVLDPFTGSGVVPAEAVKGKRVAVGIEKKKEVVEGTILPRIREAAEDLELYTFEEWAKKQKNLPEGLEKPPYSFEEWLEVYQTIGRDVDPVIEYDAYVTSLRDEGYEVFGNADYGIRVLKPEPEAIIEDEADLQEEVVPKRKAKGAEYSAALFTPEQQQKINQAIFESKSENLEHSYLSNQISKKKEFEPAGSVEEYKRRIDQMHKFGQMYSVPRRGGLQSKTAAGMYVSVSVGKKNRAQILKKAKLPDVGEIRIQNEHVVPNKFGLDVLAHELGHALHFQIAGSTGKSIRPIFDNGTLTDTEWQTILNELEQVEIATQGEDVVKAKPQYYGKGTEKLAFFLGAYVADRPLVAKIAPNAISAFVNQSMTHQVIADYLAATNEMIDKGAVVSKFIPDRRQRYQALLGKTVGDKAFKTEQIYKSSVDRATVGIAKLFKEKFRDIKDDQTTLFRAAEGITHTTDGKPAFGTKDYVYPEKGTTFTEEEVIGYSRLKYKIEVSKTDGSQRAWKWRYTPQQAKANYEQLSPEGKKLIKEFTADLTEAKDWFNRNVIAQNYGVDQTLEGWVHRIYEPEMTKGVFGWKRLQRKTASALKRRKLSTPEALQKGLVEDLQKSMLSGLVELEVKKNFNDMVEQMFGTVVLPVAEGMPLKKGWVEVSGDIYTGIARKFEKGRTVIIKDGKKIVVPIRTYQMPKDVYDRFKYYSDVSTEATLVSQAMDLLYKWWRINILTHPGTVATNHIGGAIQYASKVIEDFYVDAMFMPTDVKQESAPFAQTRLNIQALFAALSPKGWQSAPEWLYGGDTSSSFGIVRENKTAVDKANQSLDSAATKMLFTFNLVENYWKKVITYSVVGKEGVDKLSSLPVFEELTKEHEEMLSTIYDSIDVYGYDYGNRAKLLEGYSADSAGKVVAGLKPFATYLYKYEKHLESYVTGAIDPTLPPQKRIAKIMTVATMLGVAIAAQAWRDDEKETPEGDERTDPRLRARGRTYIGKDGEGNEIFVRTSKYPFIDIANAIEAVAKGDSQTFVDIVQDKAGSLSPAAKIALYVLGYTNDFEKYTPKEILLSDTVASYFPFSRILSDIAQATDPFKRKQEKWWQSFTSFIPLPGASEETLTELRGTKKSMRIPAEGEVVADVPGRTTKDVDVRNYWQDTLLSFFTGIYTTRINPEYAKAFETRTARLEEEKKEKAQYESSIRDAASMYLNEEASMKAIYNSLVQEKYGKTTNLSSDEKRGATQIRKDLKQQILLESDIPHPEFVTASGSNASRADFLADYKEDMNNSEFDSYLKTLWRAEIISSDLLDILVANDTITRGQANSIEKLDRTGFF